MCTILSSNECPLSFRHKQCREEGTDYPNHSKKKKKNATNSQKVLKWWLIIILASVCFKTRASFHSFVCFCSGTSHFGFMSCRWGPPGLSVLMSISWSKLETLFSVLAPSLWASAQQTQFKISSQILLILKGILFFILFFPFVFFFGFSQILIFQPCLSWVTFFCT